MVCVVEYGDNIGTLKNLFMDLQEAIRFSERIMTSSENEYESIGRHQWYCRKKKEFVRIENV